MNIKTNLNPSRDLLAVAIGIWSLRWKSGCVHWDLEYKEAAGEEAQKAEEAEEEEENSSTRI
jgi:hypothetical protein